MFMRLTGGVNECNFTPSFTLKRMVMQRLNKVKIFLAILVAATVFCTGVSGNTASPAVPAEQSCDCSKPVSDAENDEPLKMETNIIVRMLEMY